MDRALAIKSLSGRAVTVLTYDTGQATRSRVAGLRDVKLSTPVGDEPEQQTTSKKKLSSGERGAQVPAGREDGQVEPTVNGSA